MYKYLSLLVLINLTYCKSLTAQDKLVVLKYSIPTKQLSEFNIQKSGLRIVLPGDPDFNFSLNSKRTDIVKLNLKTSGLYKIADGFNGHIIYLEPNDTVEIGLKEIPNLKKILATKVFLGYFNILTAKGKYAWHYLFFDELDRRTEKLYPVKDFEIVRNTMLFKLKCDKALLIGRNLLDSLFLKNKISYNFKSVAQQELNAIYVSRMCTPLALISKSKMNKQYFEKLNTLHFNDSAYAVKCKDYIQAGALYTYYIDNDIDVKNLYSNLSNEIKSILLNYSGIIKDKLLSWQISDYIGKNYPAFDSCYQVYLSECKNTDLKNQVIKKVNAYVKPIKDLNKIGLAELLTRTKVQNENDKKYSLFSMCPDSIITLIDCWATWCVPCRDQMPFVHKFEKKYSKTLKIIYLSFDKDEIKWKAFVKKSNWKANQYLMDNDFSSEFSKYFDLLTIPRYILISKAGIQVLNSNMPMPALQEEFEEELNKYLN